MQVKITLTPKSSRNKVFHFPSNLVLAIAPKNQLISEFAVLLRTMEELQEVDEDAEDEESSESEQDNNGSSDNSEESSSSRESDASEHESG